jgi:hypothetical protein
MKEFNYKGVLFEAECDIDSDSHSFIVMNVFHKGENITECISDDIIIEMETALNDEIAYEYAVQQKEFEYGL